MRPRPRPPSKGRRKRSDISIYEIAIVWELVTARLVLHIAPRLGRLTTTSSHPFDILMLRCSSYIALLGMSLSRPGIYRVTGTDSHLVFLPAIVVKSEEINLPTDCSFDHA